MQTAVDASATQPPGPGGPCAVACEKLWRLMEDLALRRTSLEAFLNRLVQSYAYREALPREMDLPSSCRELLSSVTRRIDSKWTSKEVTVNGFPMPDYSFDGLDDDEARDIAKAIVDLTYAVTLENMRASGPPTGGVDA